ncbi:MAG: family intrarane metalloprotease [Clostridia bacterium]|jgi:membrane protease YdiL (CAAX protease family)|nr:family intrarane metalloprotease [Clostridia bacterium]
MKRTIIFTILVLLLGWIGLGIDILVKNDFSDGLGLLLFILAPSLLAITLSIDEKQIKSLGLKLNLKQNFKWYIFCFFFDVVVFLLVFFIGYFGKGIVKTPTITLIEVIISTALVSIPTTFIKNIFEEIGWRGYLSERLYSLVNHRLANITVGLIWSTWHLPYWLMIIPRDLFIGYSPYRNIWLIVIMSYVALINLSFLYNRIRFATKSIWPVVMIHTMNNVIVASLFANITYREQTKWFFSPGINGILYLLLLLLVNLYLEKKYPIIK